QTDDPTYGDYGVAGNTLAGGTFYYMKADEGTQAGDAKAHNVYGISSAADSQLTNTPPGYDATLGQSLGLPSPMAATGTTARVTSLLQFLELTTAMIPRLTGPPLPKVTVS
ncbi:MAG: hypothetical protein JRI65_11400, partial [Deltaproteobacteria bacterium]|nr:hypothetical protein [Deltaproteobacteria bacterium]